MKAIMIIFCMFLSTSPFAIFAQNTVPVDKLPAEAQKFISKHFPDQKIIQVEKESFPTQYEVNLNNFMELKFNSQGQCVKAESKDRQPLPIKIIPEKIYQYTIKNFPNLAIVSWEVDSNNQEIKLSNGVELIFDKNGAFLKIDD